MGQVKVDRRLASSMTNKQRRAYVREQTRIDRERLTRERRTRRAIGWTAGAVGAVAVGVVVTFAITATMRAGQVGPENMLSDGLLLTGTSGGSTMNPTATRALAAGEMPTQNASSVSAGVLDIQLYLDPTKKDSATFWTANGSTLESYVKQGYASLELHPVALSTSDANAIAAVAAFGCVANDNAAGASAMWDAMLQVSIAGLTSGHYLTAADLSKAATTAGVDDEKVTDCIDGGGFRPWATAASERAAVSVPYAIDGNGVSKTPMLVAAGSVYTGSLSDADALNSFLSDAFTKATAAATPSPTPTPTG